MKYIGIDIGGTSVKIGVVDEAGHILERGRCKTLPERGWEAVIHDFGSLCRDMIEKSQWKDEIASIGIGLPGLYLPETGMVPFCTNLYWHDVPLAAEMKKYSSLPLFADNDASVAALAEYISGTSMGTRSSILITLGTGVGAGIIMDGRIFTGHHRCAGELGHMITVAGGELCTCGARGCWERYASATALIREGRKIAEADPGCGIFRAVQGDLDAIEARTIIDLVRENDPDACRLFDWYIEHLCAGLRNLINAFDPEIILLGGGVSAAGDLLLDRVRERMPSMVFFKTMPYARIELARLKNDAGIIGAAMLGKIELEGA